MNRYFKPVLCLTAALLLAAAFLRDGYGFTDIPAPSLKEQLMVPEKSVSTYIPSHAAPGSGLAVNIIYPGKARYKDGAPVVVVAPSGMGAGGLKFTMHAAQSGFVEVRFAFPGGGSAGFTSGGEYDYRGPLCQEALRDVLLFAAGKFSDGEGRKIDELVPVKLYNNTVGVVGWANGGNIAAVTVAKYAEQLPFVGWMCFYESPMGSLFYPPNLGGGEDLLLNTHYHEGSAATGHCLIDFRKLAYQKEGQKHPGAHKKLGLPEIRGVVYFDENGNQKWDEPVEFAFDYAALPGLRKQIYPPVVISALSRLSDFNGDEWPALVANMQESQAYFEERDGSQWIREIAKQLPDCMISVVASQVDHQQHQADHPHIALQYNAWLGERQRWVRLNPDPVYTGAVAEMNKHQFANNEPNASIDADSIKDFLEPDGLIPDYVFVEAAIAEMSDRKKARKLTDVLTAPIVAYSNGAVDPNAPPKKTTPPAKPAAPAKAAPAAKPAVKKK